jgi:YHS domain-containing protein
VAYGLLGLKFTIFIFFAVIAMGLVMGLVGNRAEDKVTAFVFPAEQARDPVCGMNVEVGKEAKAKYGGETYYFCCPHCQQAFEDSPEEYLGGSRQVAHRAKHMFRYAFVDMVKEIGPQLLLGLALAASVAAVAPVGEFVGAHFGGAWGIFSVWALA